MRTLICDTETFPNYFLVAFRNVDSGRITTLEAHKGQRLDRDKLLAILKAYRIVTFNGNHFDLPLLTLALTGASYDLIKKAADRIINTGMKSWEFYREFNLTPLQIDHIDLIEVAPGTASLKLYGGRMHVERMQDCPVEFDADLTADQMTMVRDYCVNDLAGTIALFEKLQPQLELREAMGEQYGIDLRSKSDAQIAEAVIRAEIERRTGERPGRNVVPAGTDFHYVPPHWITFNTPQMRNVLQVVREAEFTVTNKGGVEMPLVLAGLAVDMGGNTFRMGIGGLHSTEKSVSYRSGPVQILDRDVASYYPNLILNCGIYPEHLGPIFLAVYKDLVDRRLAAKRAGDKVSSDTLKIVLNGTFGKLGNLYSAIYSPRLMIQVTLTGQLALLMLIEDLIGHGIQVVSANTDGVVSLVSSDRHELFERIVQAWEINCGLETEETEYKALYSRDVNNYLAVKPDGSTKGKGVFAPEGLQKNPDAPIVTRAVIEHLTRGTHIYDVLAAERDIRQFLTIRTVKGGAIDHQDQYLGRAVRWYHSLETRDQCIQYKTNRNKVAGSDGARPLMQLPEAFPSDVDLAHYNGRCVSLLKELGV